MTPPDRASWHTPEITLHRQAGQAATGNCHFVSECAGGSYSSPSGLPPR